MIKNFNSFTESKSSEWDRWVSEKISLYNEDPEGTLFDIMTSTTEIIDQFLKSPDSSASKGALESCLKGNRMFLYWYSHGTIPND